MVDGPVEERSLVFEWVSKKKPPQPGAEKAGSRSQKISCFIKTALVSLHAEVAMGAGCRALCRFGGSVAGTILNDDLGMAE